MFGTKAHEILKLIKNSGYAPVINHGRATHEANPKISDSFLNLLIANGNTVRPVLAEIVRYPAYAGSFYP